jgi:hypothetical protein
MNFYTSLITFEGTRYDWKKLVGPVDLFLEKEGSPKVAVVSGDSYAQSELSALEVLAYQLYIPFLTASWNRHLRPEVVSKNRVPQDLLRDFVDYLSHLRARVMFSMRHQKKLRSQVLRYINISSSHLRASSSGLQSKAAWVITLEDDGHLTDEAALGSALASISASFSPEDVLFFDISDSFSFAQLGVEHIVAASDRRWLGLSGHEVVRASIPFTNTMCATVMSREFVVRWSSYLEECLSKKVIRLIPVDWLLNRFILKEKRLQQAAFYHFVPGVVKQLSMEG